MTNELQALQDADFGWVQSLESVWSDEGTGDAGPNQGHIDAIITDLKTLTRAPNPPGRALLGQAGIGKTHLVGVLRREAWANGCWFVLLDVVGITDFWKSAALSFLTSLLQEMPDGQRQYEAVIAGVARQFKIEKEVKIAFDSPTIEPKKIVDLLVGGLMKKDMSNALRYQDVFRALALLRSHDLSTVGVAHAWLQGYDADPTMRQSLGFLTPPPSAVDIVKGLCWVMSLASPLLVAIDQIDGVLAIGGASVTSDLGEGTTFAALLTSGLLDLTTVVGRGMIVLTSLPDSWEAIKSYGPTALVQRFSPPAPLSVANSEMFVRRLIADRLAPAYDKAGIRNGVSTGPFTDAAILSVAGGVTPRTILMRCDEHRKLCLAEGRLIPCHSLAGAGGPIGPGRSSTDDGSLGQSLTTAARKADIDGLIDDKNDGKLGMLLRDSFDLYAKQIPPDDDYDVVSKADPAKQTPPLHGRLTFVDHRDNDSERHFCFRALQHASAVALCARFKAALTASGISAKIEHRHLIVVRRGPPPSGPKTQELFNGFRAAGGIEIDPSDDDLRTFVALREMRDAALAESRYDAFERWLVEAKPLCETTFFKAAGLCPPPIPGADARTSPGEASPAAQVSAPESLVVADGLRPRGHEGRETAAEIPNAPVEAPPRAAPPPAPAAPAADPSTAIPVGHRIAGGEAVDLPIAVLPRHTAIIAGAGSGKTVLLRRLVEEAALAGIPAIVIDPNNDLSRLGDAWPERPAGFDDADAAKAERYAATVEVVVWTPGIHAGNPLFLSVLPDFAAVGADPDERAQAVTMAVDTLGPLAGARNDLAKGVLADALRHFAGAGGGTLKDMTALLADLPEGVSEIDKADTIANKLANGLRAAVATNPLLKATGPVLDPKLLFFGPDATRTRVSVINLSGLASDEAKQDFVNRLQMTLFGWIKRHPSPRGMLYVIDEAQTFIPSGAAALSKTSGVTLVAQARKYGLGMIAVTQAPRGIDNKVVSNCTTHFLGKQNAPATIEAARDLIAAAGGKADDLGKLATGEFYFKTERSGRPVKVRTPICLSWHPANPPTPEEVVVRAKASAPDRSS